MVWKSKRQLAIYSHCSLLSGRTGWTLTSERQGKCERNENFAWFHFSLTRLPLTWCVPDSSTAEAKWLWVAFKSHIKIYAAFLVFCMLSAFYIHCSSSHISSNLFLFLLFHSTKVKRVYERDTMAKKKFDFVATVATSHPHLALAAVACHRRCLLLDRIEFASVFFNIPQCVFCDCWLHGTHKF